MSDRRKQRIRMLTKHHGIRHSTAIRRYEGEECEVCGISRKEHDPEKDPIAPHQFVDPPIKPRSIP